MKDLLGGFKADSILRDEDLEAIDETLYEAREEELTARTIVNIKTDIPEGAETYSYDRITRRGAAKIFAYGADDVPLVDADIEKHTVHIFGIVVGFRINVQERRNAQMAGKPVEPTKAAAARRAIAEKENDFFYTGSDEHNAEGLVNFTGIQDVSPTDTEESDTEWAEKTGPEIIEDIRLLRHAVNQRDGYNADTLLLPPDQYSLLDRPWNEDVGDRSIREVLDGKGWFDTVQSVPDLEDAGAGDDDVAMVLDTMPDVIEMGLPMDVMRHEPIRLPNMADQVNVEERTAGCIIRFTLGVAKMEGI